MNLETFIEKFNLFADAPNAVAKMRELVLQWAVQGRLVRQDPKEEAASNLIRGVVQARKKLVAAKVVRDETADFDFLDRVETDLPSGWVRAPLSVYVSVIMGQSPPSSTYNEFAQGLPFYQGKAQFGRLYPTAMDWCTEPTKIGEPGDVVISVRAPVGPTNMLRERSCIGRGLASLRSLGGDQMHLLYTLRAFEQSIAALGVGSTFVAISKSDLDEFLIPIPPLAEQKRIVAKVEELMALCDRLEAQQQERETRHAALARASLARFADAPTPANLNFIFHKSYDIAPADLRKTILTLAVQGKLVPQDPNDEPVATLIAGLAHLRRELLTERKIRNQKVSDSPTPSDFPFDIPDGWRWIRFGEAVTLLGGYAYESGAYVPKSSNQIIRLGNVKNDALLLNQKPAFIPDPLAEQTAEFAIREGDILITMTGTKAKRDYAFTLGVKPTDLVGRRLFLNQRVGAIRPFRSELVPLINMFLKSDQLLDLIFATATGTANQANIGTGSILDLPFPLPSLTEQRRIVAKVDELMALVDALESQLATARATAEKLMQALVAELTGQRTINDPALENTTPNFNFHKDPIGDLKEEARSE